MKKNIFKFQIIIIIFITILSISLLGQEYEVNEPRQIILTWQNDPQTTMTITWRTDQEGENNTVYYSSEENINLDEYNKKKADTSTFEETTAWIHSAELTDLQPDTIYWVVIVSDGYKSEKFCFETAPENSEDLVFIIGSDAQHLQTQMPVIREVLSKAAKENPDFFMYSGDIVNAELSEYEWDLFFDLWDELMITDEGRRIPIIPTLGNHEVVGGYGGKQEKAIFYFNRFKVPEPKDYYSIQYGPDLLILSLNTDHTSTVDGEQLIWLEETLKENQNITWIIPQYHDGGWWGSGKINAKIRSYWLPLFEEYGVDLVHSGHIHFYMRSFPLSGFKNITDKIDNMIDLGIERAKADFDPDKNYAPPLQKNLLNLSRGKWEETGFSSLEEGLQEMIYMLSLFVIQNGEPTNQLVFNQICTTQLFKDFWNTILVEDNSEEMIDEENGIIYFGVGGLGASMDPSEKEENPWWLAESGPIHHYYKVFIDSSNSQLNLTPYFYYPEENIWEEGRTDIIIR